MTKYSVLLIFLILAFATGCSAADSGSDGRYVSVVEMNDTTASYDLWVTVRTSVKCTVDSLDMTVRIISPDRVKYSVDTWTVPMDRNTILSGKDEKISGRMSVFSYDIRALYRTGIIPVQPGKWELSFDADPSFVEGIWASVEKRKQ